jgi:hypothetical protein
MSGGTNIEAPKPDPMQQAYYAYMLEEQKNNAASAAATEEDKQAQAAIKSSGIAGYNTAKQNIFNQYSSGILNADAAQKALTEYEAKYKLGTGYTQADLNELSSRTISDLPGKTKMLAGQTYKDILGRSATESELQSFSDLYKTGDYKLSNLVDTIKSGKEYQNAFNNNYLASYYDTMYGKQTTEKDASGVDVKTGKRTFNYDTALDPTFSGDLAKATGITPGATQQTFTGTPAEIEEQQKAMSQKREFAYNAGLTSLQGQIDQETQKIKNEGSKDVSRIAGNAQVLSNLTSGFWS